MVYPSSIGSGGPPRLSIWNQWSITVSHATPPWSATLAVSASRGPRAAAPPGWLKLA